MVLGRSTRRQPAGVDGLLDPIATIAPATTATTSTAATTSRIRRSRNVVLRSGVLTLAQ
jgi:hypothetical protein